MVWFIAKLIHVWQLIGPNKSRVVIGADSYIVYIQLTILIPCSVACSHYIATVSSSEHKFAVTVWLFHFFKCCPVKLNVKNQDYLYPRLLET